MTRARLYNESAPEPKKEKKNDKIKYYDTMKNVREKENIGYCELWIEFENMMTVKGCYLNIVVRWVTHCGSHLIGKKRNK